MVSILASRECYRDEYWRKHDPILDDRLFWRAQTFRHTVHLLPGQTILELGCGGLHFTRALLRVSRKANPITSVTFQSSPLVASDVVPDVELRYKSELAVETAERALKVAVDSGEQDLATQIRARLDRYRAR